MAPSDRESSAPTVPIRPASPEAPAQASPAPAATPSGPPEELPPEPELARGTAVGRYLLLKRIGAGGMGRVYAAYDPELDRRVCVKLLRPEVSQALGAGARAGLLREAQAMAKLAHPNVVTVHDVGHLDGQLFIAMELVEGGTLRQWLGGQPRGWRRVLEVFRAAGEGLAAAHAAGLVHRDFKPDNVLVGADGRVRVTDFGLVRPASGDDAPLLAAPHGSHGPLATPLTGGGVVMGTPAYMPPEQFRGEATDARSDQFSFCVALHEALYGERPFSGGTPLALVRAIDAGEVPPAPAGARVPSWLRAVVLRGLRASPAERYPDMRALLDELSRDRTRGLVRATAAAVGVALVLGGLVASRLLDARRERACEGGQAQLAGIWDAPRRAAIQQAFAATGTPFAADAWSKVEAELSRYSSAWVAMDAEACRATFVRGDQSEEVLQRRRQCLRLRRAALETLTGLFASADAVTVERAVLGAQGLPDLSGCGALEVLADPLPPPSAPALRAQVEKLREQLAGAQVRLVSGRYAEGVEVASKVAREAEPLPFKALAAEALYFQGALEGEAGDAAGAARTLERAVLAAEASGHDAMAAEAWTELVLVAGRKLRRFEVGHQAAGHAAAVLERIGARDGPRSRLLTYEGTLLRVEGRYGEAVERHRRALALAERAYGPERPEVARVLIGLGSALRALARTDEALAAYTRAMAIWEKVLGAEHPNLASAHTNRGNVLQMMGRLDEALAEHRRALAIAERAKGPESGDAAYSLNNLGVVELALGRYADARRDYERALAIHQRRAPDSPEVADTLANLGVVAIQERDHARALPLCERAVALREERLGPEHPTLAMGYTNLAHVYSGLGRLAAARALFEKALALDERALGPLHPNLAEELTGLGRLAIREGAPAKGVAPLTRALALREKGPADSADLAETRFTLARALWLTGERARALELARTARDGYRAGPTRRPPDLAEVERWLAGRGG